MALSEAFWQASSFLGQLFMIDHSIFINRALVVSMLGMALLVSACAPLQPKVVLREGVPTYPPSRYVELLKIAPKQPYQELAVIEATGTPGMYSVQVQEEVRKQAQQLGADAVILQDLSRVTAPESKLNPSLGSYELIPGEIIPAFRGIAIKYR
jgi:hypothetical protein